MKILLQHGPQISFKTGCLLTLALAVMSALFVCALVLISKGILVGLMTILAVLIGSGIALDILYLVPNILGLIFEVD